MDDLHINSYLSHYAFFVFAETNERCEGRHKFPTRAQFFRSGDNQLCWTHPGQLRRRVEAHHCEPTSTRWPHGYSIPFSSSSLTQRVIMLRRVFTTKLFACGTSSLILLHAAAAIYCCCGKMRCSAAFFSSTTTEPVSGPTLA